MGQVHQLRDRPPRPHDAARARDHRGGGDITTDDNCNITICGQAQLSEQLVEFVDILPTLVEAAGLPQLDLCPEFSRNVSLCRELSY